MTDSPSIPHTLFDDHTAVTALGDGRFRAHMHPHWWVLVGPNGGYVAAVMLRALEEAVGDRSRQARTLTLHYLAPPAEGDVEIEVVIEREGRSLTSVSARMTQNGRPLVRALAAFSKSRPGPEFRHMPMPEAALPEQGTPGEGRIVMHDRYEYRWLGGGQPDGGAERAEIQSWLRLAEPRTVDTLALAAYCDALPPALFAVVGPETLRGVPTVELTIHFLAEVPLPSARPDDFVLLTVETPQVVSGFLQEDVAIWSRDGVLLARSRQLALNI